MLGPHPFRADDLLLGIGENKPQRNAHGGEECDRTGKDAGWS